MQHSDCFTHKTTELKLIKSLLSFKRSFCTSNSKEVHHTNLENLNLKNNLDSPTEFVGKLKNLEMRAHPPLKDLPVVPLSREVATD